MCSQILLNTTVDHGMNSDLPIHINTFRAANYRLRCTVATATREAMSRASRSSRSSRGDRGSFDSFASGEPAVAPPPKPRQGRRSSWAALAAVPEPVIVPAGPPKSAIQQRYGMGESDQGWPSWSTRRVSARRRLQFEQ
jgi:hypothetical protein